MATFEWINFYEELAAKIKSYKSNRQGFISLLQNGYRNCSIEFPNLGVNGQLNDIDPFTFFGMFNCQIRANNKQNLLSEFKNSFELSAVVPSEFNGIPSINNMRKRIFTLDSSIQTQEIDILWELFITSIEYSDKPNNSLNENNFKETFDKLFENYEISLVEITMGLYWIAPNMFIPLDQYTKKGIENLDIAINEQKQADVYLELIKKVKEKIMDRQLTIPEFVANSYNTYKSTTNNDDNKKPENNKKIITDKNIILYGPPGTGKTYNTAIYAVAICNHKGNISEVKEMNYEKILEEYKELKERGRIQFVTFHQSYGYEEFVEGIKPILDDDQLLYNIEDGAFKNFCQKEFDDSNFEKIWDEFVKKEVVKKSGKITVDTKQTYRELTWDDKKKRFDVTNYKDKGQFIDCDTVLAVYKGEFNYNKGSGTNQVKYSTANGIIKLLKDKYELTDYKTEEATEPKVFIIDEINRGNISKIFGELITLIEESKREGEAEELSCTLPYSKVEFSVPSNVYILGTMNTADKSLTAIDTALRRRFKFIEMMPNYNLLPNDIEGIELSKMLQAMNERIEVLLDREHTIGHSYFMKVKNFGDLQEAMNLEIIPLLQEYFFDDYENIRLVLADNQTEEPGKQFIRAIDCDNNKLFGNNAPDFGEKKRYIVIKDAQVEAYIKIYDSNYLSENENSTNNDD